MISVFKNFHLGKYIVGYMVRNVVLRRHASRAIKHDFRMYIQRFISPNENFEYGYPHSNALLQSRLKLEHCKLHKAASHPTKCDVINDVKVFTTVYQDILSQHYIRIYCRKFLTLSNQTLHYKSKCTRILFAISLLPFTQIISEILRFNPSYTVDS